jgi:hypothetical protein
MLLWSVCACTLYDGEHYERLCESLCSASLLTGPARTLGQSSSANPVFFKQFNHILLSNHSRKRGGHLVLSLFVWTHSIISPDYVGSLPHNCSVVCHSSPLCEVYMFNTVSSQCVTVCMKIHLVAVWRRKHVGEELYFVRISVLLDAEVVISEG